MSRKSTRTRGAQPGNQNARKHGLYSSVRTTEPRDPLSAAPTVKALNHDIAIARRKLESLLDNDPNNFRLIGYVFSLQNRLIRTKRLIMDHRRAAMRRRSQVRTQETNRSQRSST